MMAMPGTAAETSVAMSAETGDSEASVCVVWEATGEQATVADASAMNINWIFVMYVAFQYGQSTWVVSTIIVSPSRRPVE